MCSAFRPLSARGLVGLALGLRQGEALGLWEDIALDAGLLRVRRALQRQRGGGLVFTDPKTQRSKRTLPLPVPLLTALRDHQQQQAKEQISAGSLWHGCPCVFTTPMAPLLASAAHVACLAWEFAGGAPGARTLNPRIKSPLLCH